MGCVFQTIPSGVGDGGYPPSVRPGSGCRKFDYSISCYLLCRGISSRDCGTMVASDWCRVPQRNGDVKKQGFQYTTQIIVH